MPLVLVLVTATSRHKNMFLGRVIGGLGSKEASENRWALFSLRKV